MKTVAGIDLGTQSMKVYVYDFESKKAAAIATCPVDIISENDGTREQKTEWYDAAMKTCFDGISAEAKASIEAIGVSGQQHGFVPLDAAGKALYKMHRYG